LYPLGEVTDYIKPGRTITFMTLRKKHVSGGAADFNKLEMNFAHSIHRENDFSMNSFSS